MTSPQPGPQEAPHFTKEMLIEAMHHLSGDFAASVSGEATDDRDRSRLEHARRIGLDQLAAEAIANMEKATKDIRELAWPGGLDQRYLGLVGTVDTLARISTQLLPHDDKHAHLSALAPVMHRAMVASGSNLRKKRADRLRGLHVIIDPSLTGDHEVDWVADQALMGGAVALQLRVTTQEKGEWLPLALHLKELCDDAGAMLLISGHPDVAVAVDAGGVHLGPHALPLTATRRVLAPWQIAGTSGTLVDQAQNAYESGADYVATTPETLRSVRELIPVDGPPVIAVGEFTPDSAAEVARAGANAICVSSAVTTADDPKLTAIDILLSFRNAR